MSSIANLSSAPPALPSLHIHTHGHKRGSHAEATDDSSSGTALQASVGATQSLFGRLLQSLEKVIGVKLGSAASAAASAGTTAKTAAAAGVHISVKA
jgi:hypothetical protein